MEIKIVNESKHELPDYATKHSSGIDLRANIEYPITLKPLERALIPTGLFLEIPSGCEGQIRPRSGLAVKKGITVLNTPGTIDADYRGEVKVILINLSNDQVAISDGERICQLVFAQVEQVTFSQVQTLTETTRGEGGFGHTGL